MPEIVHVDCDVVAVDSGHKAALQTFTKLRKWEAGSWVDVSVSVTPEWSTVGWVKRTKSPLQLADWPDPDLVEKDSTGPFVVDVIDAEFELKFWEKFQLCSDRWTRSVVITRHSMDVISSAFTVA